MNYKNYAFIWDIDGVIADSPHEESWRKVAESPEWGLQGLTSDFYLKYVASKPRYEGAHNILEKLGGYEKFNAKTEEQKDEILKRYAEQKNNLIKDLIEKGQFGVFESSVIFLLNAKEKNILCAAASASKNANSMLTKINAYKIAEKHNLKYSFLKEKYVYDLFDVNVCGVTVENGKAGLFKLAFEKLKEKNPDVKIPVVFEDGLTGIEAAKSNNYFAVAIVRIGKKEDFEKVNADIIVDDLSQLKVEDIIEKIK